MSQETTQRTWGPLAVIGLVIAIIVLAWLAVMIVRFIPVAFTSLATLAERTNNADSQTLDIDASHEVINTGVALDITWNDFGRDGSYAFTYECEAGVAAEIRTETGDVVPLPCDTPYTFADNTFNTSVRFMSERERFSDVVYRIMFTPERGDARDAEALVTVINGSIPLAGADEDEPTTEDDGVADSDESTSDDTVVTGTTENEIRYRYVETVTYSTPVSDPQGYTDLTVAYESVGVVKNGVYTPRTTLEESEAGAFQFTVKNIGTRTSSYWNFEAILPTGERYRSAAQEPLKPQERARITVAFDSAGREGAARISAEVTGGNDRTTNNNEFSWSVSVTD